MSTSFTLHHFFFMSHSSLRGSLPAPQARPNKGHHSLLPVRSIQGSWFSLRSSPPSVCPGYLSVILTDNTGRLSNLSLFCFPRNWNIVGAHIHPQKRLTVADLSTKGIYSKDIGKWPELPGSLRIWTLGQCGWNRGP